MPYQDILLKATIKREKSIIEFQMSKKPFCAYADLYDGNN